MNKDIKKNIKIEDVYYNIYFFFLSLVMFEDLEIFFM